MRPKQKVTHFATNSARCATNSARCATIGIGGSLTTPPLPHHRAYGSVHGGSTDLCGQAGQQGRQPELGEEGVGQGDGKGGTVAEPPGSVRTAGGLRRQVLTDACGGATLQSECARVSTAARRRREADVSSIGRGGARPMGSRRSRSSPATRQGSGITPWSGG